jgi:beta-xylosidase
LTCRLILSFVLSLCFFASIGAQRSRVWVADNGDGTYKNPIIHADYSDPDVVRVGTDYYMTASSFNAVPGLPVLHSKDLVNWTLINHAIRRLEPEDVFSKPQHGGGVWAPAIRYHAGLFYIYYSDPDYGIFVTTAKDPAGEWSKPALVKAAKGWIDPCPLWDDDGKAYLVHAFAGSRAGIKSILVVNRMSADGMSLLDDGAIVFDGHVRDPTVEGPKFYKLNGYYYILAPAGGVPTGWQLALRSKNIYGPYERRVVLAQGKSAVNGPHQGALVDTVNGESWFVHFQDKGAYGRVVHLQPVVWRRGFPVIGVNGDRDGTGEPVATFKKPNVGRSYEVATPPDSDEFNSADLGRQWQWHANPGQNWAYPFPERGALRMMSVEQPTGYRNLWDAPNLLLQKLPAENFVAEVKLRIDPRFEGERFGFVVMGLDYSYLAITYRGGRLYLSQVTAEDADKGTNETESTPVLIEKNDVLLSTSCNIGGDCSFMYSTDGKTGHGIGEHFKAREGKWIGAKIGFFFNRPAKFNDAGSVDIDWIRFNVPMMEIRH